MHRESDVAYVRVYIPSVQSLTLRLTKSNIRAPHLYEAVTGIVKCYLSLSTVGVPRGMGDQPAVCLLPASHVRIFPHSLLLGRGKSLYFTSSVNPYAFLCWARVTPTLRIKDITYL